jgi:uncharacterized membrane protein
MSVHNQANLLKRNLFSGVLFGIGLAAFIDETVFHQLLHWHHFYDKSTTALGLVSDGVFHAFSWFATIASLFMFADLRRKSALNFLRWLGGVFLGYGLFQLYDGTVQHKVMRIHQIRYNVDILPYDMIWNAVALASVIIGFRLLSRSRSKFQQNKGNKTNESS